MARMSKVTIGQVVPDFTLPASSGGEVSLSDLRGKKVIVYFYPKDMTPGCTQEACDLRNHNDELKELNTVTIGISGDDLKSHTKFIDKHSLPFVLLSDVEHTVSELFGVWKLKKNFGKEYMGIERSTFLIDESGKLVQEWRKVRVNGHIDEVLNAIKES